MAANSEEEQCWSDTPPLSAAAPSSGVENDEFVVVTINARQKRHTKIQSFGVFFNVMNCR